MRPASSASLAAVRRFAKRDTLRNLSSLMVFRAPPQRIEIVEAASGERGGAAACEALHRSETLAESHVRAAQCRFGIHTEPPREVDDGEDHIAEFVAHSFAAAGAHRLVQLIHFFAELLEHRFRLWPVKADRRGFLLQALRPEQRGQTFRDAVKE